jgi:uncharacterized protein YqfB (UPF0267 family)
MSVHDESTELAPGVRLEVIRHEDRRIVCDVELVSVGAKRTAVLKVGGQQRTLTEGDILHLTVDA